MQSNVPIGFPSAGRAIASVALTVLLAQPVTATGVSPHAQAESDSTVLAERVRTALHADAFFYDEHVTVTAENGTVTLHGFVFSDWDLRSAVRIASKAAAGHPIIDDLSIKLGGNK